MVKTYTALITCTGKAQKVSASSLVLLMDKVEHYILYGMIKLPCKIEISVI